MNLPKWWDTAAYALLVVPVIGMNFGDTVLFSGITLGVVVGAVGLAKKFKILK
jgi:hypothetical protein